EGKMAFWGFPKRGRQVVWAYRTMMDEKVCEDCWGYEDREFVCEAEEGEGEEETPKRYFEYAEEVTEDFWKVNLHPNCRCYLERVDMNEG
ncbi:MAG: hypothetical protein QW231_06580, partial [Candidatus Bathyarchaeia archaeon]